jgi:hypothetical protein
MPSATIVPVVTIAVVRVINIIIHKEIESLKANSIVKAYVNIGVTDAEFWIDVNRCTGFGDRCKPKSGQNN